MTTKWWLLRAELKTELNKISQELTLLSTLTCWLQLINKLPDRNGTNPEHPLQSVSQSWCVTGACGVVWTLIWATFYALFVDPVDR